ncbi:glycosyltransferase family 4 protein [Notoacmeibacter sp. MSK16QG-6]|uniref:glycosyltransferase family 4 protein n=1 Tax=Notoacmeibacter sp. MSK16QG-6 TaxID=2957982 RepID=UPI00209CA444|nr:glycosyltransferase family 4 protein [Notoacmeibacter sp. MSK16QG-6]MCP1198560.1 glycosyltransferase family 4 protein [Notoacmeibacter sp. MSK16QG-6]
MHLVFVTSLIPPETPASGFDVANAAMLAALDERVERVTVLGYKWPGQPVGRQDDRMIVLGEMDARTQNASLATKLGWLGRAVRTGLTFASAKLRQKPSSSLAAELAALPPIDAFVWNSVQMAGAYPELFRDRPALFIAHNVEHQSARQNAAAASGAFERALYRREAALLEELEADLCRQASHLITLTDDDRKALGMSAEDATVLPLVTPAAVNAPSIEPRVDATMIGSWGWTPNRIGLEWFLQQVAPCLPADFTVEIAGDMPSDIRSPAANIRFVGRVEDATEFLLGGRIVPLASRAGTGVQLKTLETFELGMPAVATTSSLRGIAHLPHNVTVSDDPAEFASLMVKQAADARRIDGSAFHLAQKAALGDAMDRALAALGRDMAAFRAA